MADLATRIKEKLDAKGLSAYKLEKLIGLKRSAINNILYGKSKSPGIDIIQSIAKGLNCSVSELLGDVALNVSPSADEGLRGGKNIDKSPENLILYALTLQTLGALIQKKKCSLTREQIFSTIEEVYVYSLKAQRKDVDAYFAEWMINKFQIPS